MKIIQIVTSQVQNPQGNLDSFIYGLGEDGELYMYNFANLQWETIQVLRDRNEFLRQANDQIKDANSKTEESGQSGG